MYIKKIVINKIRCFEHIEIDLSSEQGAKMWTLLLGDNGVGKTTVLRCIAMALMGPTNASGLLSELYGEWVRGQSDKPEEATIRIEFDKGRDDSTHQWIETKFERTNSGDTKVTQETSSGSTEEFPWDDIFVCGYGAARRAFGTKDYSEYTSIDSLYTLFNYDSPLQNPELILRRIKDTGVKLKEMLSWIEKILMLEEGSIDLGFKGITVSGPWGKFMPLGSIGDGHHSTLAWLSDMLGWAFFYDKDLFKEARNKISGIVLLDEIEQHLHPSWQKQFIKLLSDQFPNLQFIATTHSPLCAIGTANLPADKCSLVLLAQEDDHVRGYDKLLPPHGRRADQVLTSYLFGLDTSGDNKTKAEIQKYSYLAGKKRSSDEEAEYKTLFAILESKLGTQETDLEQFVSEAISETLRKNPETNKYNDKSLDFEIKRQLNDLLKGS